MVKIKNFFRVSQNPSGFYLGLEAEICSWFCENREKSINDTPA